MSHALQRWGQEKNAFSLIELLRGLGFLQLFSVFIPLSSQTKQSKTEESGSAHEVFMVA